MTLPAALALLLSATAASSGSDTPLVVVGDVVRLRQKPSASAPTVARLQIGTPLKLREERPGWVRVEVPEHPGMEGWISSPLVDGWPTLEALRKRAWSAEGTPRFVELSERVVAFDGTHAKDLELVERAYRGAGRDADAARVRARLDGTEPFLLAVCRSGRALLAAQVTVAGATSLTEPGDQARPLLLQALRDADALPWWKATPAGPLRQLGSAFAHPALAKVWNEDSEAFGGPVDATGAEAKLVLGKCEGEGAILSTTPLALLPRGKVSASALATALAAADAALSPAPLGARDAVRVGAMVERPFEGARFLAASMRYQAIWSRHHDDLDERAWVWGLLDARGAAQPFGAASSLLRAEPANDRWLKRALPADSALRLGVVDVEAGDEGAASGLQLIVATPDAPVSGALCAFNRDGC